MIRLNLLLTMLGTFLCGAMSATGQELPKTIVTFGDSTTARRGSLEVYSDLLSTSLGTVEAPVRVINAGVGGNTTRDARQRLESDVLRHSPDLVIVQFGINDAAVDVWRTPSATLPRVPVEE